MEEDSLVSWPYDYGTYMSDSGLFLIKAKVSQKMGTYVPVEYWAEILQNSDFLSKTT